VILSFPRKAETQKNQLTRRREDAKKKAPFSKGVSAEGGRGFVSRLQKTEGEGGRALRTFA
jgi:hypothetical protein